VSYGRYLAEVFLKLIRMVVKIKVNSFVSFSVGLIRSTERSLASKINSNQYTVSSHFSWTIESLEMNSARELSL